MCKISIETSNENTRNDSYVIINKDKNNYIFVSYATNLCEEVNKAFSLNLNYEKDDLRIYSKFKKFVNELEEKGYSIYQLTRL